MFLKEFMFSLAIAALMEPKGESKSIYERNNEFDKVDRKTGAYWERQKLLSQAKASDKKPVTPYTIQIQEDGGKKSIILYSIEDETDSFRPIYSDINQAINEVKRLKEDFLRRGFKVETHIDLLGEKKRTKENNVLVCPNCHIGLSAKVWDIYTAKVEGYKLDKMLGLSQGELIKHKEFETHYRCPTCHVEVAGAELLA